MTLRAIFVDRARTCFISLVLLFLVIGQASAWQWTWSNPKPTGNPLIGLKFIDSVQVIAISENGEVVASVDAGETWKLRGAGIGALAMSVAKTVDGQIVFAAGDEGRIWKSQDGGRNWSIKATGTATYFDLCQMDAEVTLAVGTHGMVMRTQDRGETWQRTRIDSVGPNLIGVHCGANGFAMGVGEGGLVVRSRDAGKTWQTLLPPVESMLAGVFFADSLRGFIAGEEGVVLDTRDGGATWSKQVLDSVAFLKNFHATGSEIMLTGSSGSLWKNTMAENKWKRLESGTDYFLGPASHSGQSLEMVAGNNGLLIKSVDQGQTWKNLRQGSDRQMIGMTVIDSQNWVAFGMGASILRTKDAGSRWTEWFDTKAPGLLAGDFWGSQKGLVSGYNGVILKTDNGGETWERTESRKPNRFLDGVAWADSLIAVVVGDSGTLLRTVDAGRTWIPQLGIPGLSDQTLSGVQFLSKNTGIVVGYRGLILKTENQGLSWTPQSVSIASHLFALSFLNPSLGMAVGNKGVVLSTRDGGSTWARLSTGSPDDELYGVAMLSPDTAVVVGEWLHGPIVRMTINGGQTWQSIAPASDGILNGISLITSGQVAVVGGGGALILGEPSVKDASPIKRTSSSISSVEFTAQRCGSLPLVKCKFTLPYSGRITLKLVSSTGNTLKEHNFGRLQKGRHGLNVPFFKDPKAVFFELHLQENRKSDRIWACRLRG